MLSIETAHAAIYATGTFTQTVYRFESDGNGSFTQSNFAVLPTAGVLAGIAYRGSTNEFFVGDVFGSQIFKLDGSGNLLTTYSTSTLLGVGFGPTALAVGPDNRVYAAGFGNADAGVFVLDEGTATFNVALDTGNAVLNSAVGGIGFAGSNLVISTFGAGVYQFGTTTISPFPGAGPGASAVAQIATDPLTGQIFVGSSDLGALGPPVDANRVYSFNADGTSAGSVNIAPLLPYTGPGTPSSEFVSPSGVLVDPNGNLVIAAAGQTSPGSDPGLPANGGLFMFDQNNALVASLTGIASLSNVTYATTAVPEPSTVSLIAIAGILSGLAKFRKRFRLPRTTV